MTPIAALFCLLAQAEWIDRLGDDDPAVRDTASAELRHRGSRAEAELERALLHPSLEVRGRAADLLEEIPGYVLRTLPRRPEYRDFCRRWNAVIDAAIWKRPIPKDLWEGVEEPVEELREISRAATERVHTPLEILGELGAQASKALSVLVCKVGVEGFEGEQPLSHRIEFAARNNHLLKVLFAARPDAECFEEVYGTLVLLEREEYVLYSVDWSREDWALAIRFLVDLRRRPGAPPLVPPKTLEEALDLARRGPILRGIADALGRSFANRGRGPEMLKQQQEEQKLEIALDSPYAPLCQVYAVLMDLDREIGVHFYRPELLRPAKAAIPSRHAPVADRNEALFAQVCAVPATDGALRVVREILDSRASIPELPVAVDLLREIGRRVDRAAGVP